MAMMTEPYRYNCIDKSILLPFYKKYYVAFFFRFIPAWLTANTITIISTGFVVLMAAIVLLFEKTGSPVSALIMAFCLHNYLLGDHLDGMQAKESNTSSPLGEFLDHYLDVYNGAIVLYMLTIFLGPVPKRVFLVLMVLNCIAFAVTMVEELERKELIFGPLGTLEGVLFLIFFFISWLMPPLRELWQRELFLGLPAYWVIIGMLGLGYLGTCIDILIRIGRIPLPFATFVACCISCAFLLEYQAIDVSISWLVLILFSGDYIARVMGSYLLSQPHKYPDIVSTVTIILAFTADLSGWLSEDMCRLYLKFLIGWLLIKVLFSFTSTVYQLREHWYWINPR